MSLNVEVFKEAQTGAGGGGGCQVLGSSAPWLGSWCEEEGLWEEAGWRGPCAGLADRRISYGSTRL